MRVLLAVGLAAFVVLSGCIGAGPDSTTSPAGSTMDPPILLEGIVAHQADGVLVDAARYGGELPQMVERYIANRPGGEPTVAIDRDGVAIYPTIDFDLNLVATSLATTKVYRSLDEGVTWTESTPSLGNLGAVPAAPTSLDPYVYADPVTGRLFNIDLNLAVGGFLSYSDDSGVSWISQPGCCGLPVDDHQTLFSGPATTLVANPLLYPDRVLYFCVNQIAQAECTHSLDGGLTWSAGTPVYLGYDPQPENPIIDENLSNLCGGLHGHGHASEVTGTVFLPKGHCGNAYVARSTDNGLTWETVRLDNPFGFDGHEAIVSTDQAGNVYYFFLDGETRPRLAVSRDDGQTWSRPINVTAPGVTTAKFPSIVAGEKGRIAFLYIGSTTPSGIHVFDTNATTGELEHKSELENATWEAYVGFSMDALADDPVFASIIPHDPADPLARGNCFDRCYRDVGGMYDFMDIEVNPLTGQVWTALVDMCNEHVVNNQPACNSAAGTFKSWHQSRGAVGVQTGGTFLGTRIP